MPEKVKILVVEDDPEQRTFLTGLLSHPSYSFEIHAAADGEEALELVYLIHPAIIITDVTMPNMSGFEFCKKVRSDPTTASIPLIFLTAKSTPQDRIAGLRVGADDYLAKPFTPLELVLRIQAILRRTSRHVVPAHNPGLLLSGQLAATSIIDVLQSFGRGNVSGRFIVNGPQKGTIDLRDGFLARAVVTTSDKEITGLKAWLRMTAWSEGRFEFWELQEDEEPGGRISPMPVQSLAMEAAYYKDEYQRHRKVFPSLEIYLFWEGELDETLEPIDVSIHFAVGQGAKLEELIDDLAFTDLEILQAVMRLARNKRLTAKAQRRTGAANET